MRRLILALGSRHRSRRAAHNPQQPTVPTTQTTTTDPETKKLETMVARFAPVDLTADVAALPANERQALARLVEAAKVFDALFLRQVWAGNEAMLLDLARDNSPLGRARQHYFLINKGPWSRLDHNEPFVAGVPPKPAEANFYPAGATKDEVEGWLKGLSAAERTRATGFFTTIRRGADGKFIAVPYSLEYQGEIARVSTLLREAAALTTQPTLKSYLEKRAAALLSNDYYDSDIAWMSLDASIEPTIGPYETYEDEWFNYKAAFEAFITLRDDVETQKLARFGSELQEIENNLPIDPKFRNPKLGAMAPIRVVNTVFSSGDANRGVQTAAFNLPNDERVITEKGSKRVMLKNNQEAKFKMVLQPISMVALAADDRKHVSFDAFFTHILMHELMHGLGPHNITVGGRATNVRQEFKDSLQHDRRSQGRCVRALRAAVPRRSREARQGVQRDDVHDLPRVDVPLDPVRHQRGARPRRRDSAQLLPRQRRRDRGARTAHSRSTRSASGRTSPI